MNQSSIKMVRLITEYIYLDKRNFKTILWIGKYTFGRTVEHNLNLFFQHHHSWQISFFSDLLNHQKWWKYYKRSHDLIQYGNGSMQRLSPKYQQYICTVMDKNEIKANVKTCGRYIGGSVEQCNRMDRNLHCLLSCYRFILKIEVINVRYFHNPKSFYLFVNDCNIWEEIEKELRHVCEIQDEI